MTSRLFFAVNVSDEAARAVARMIADLEDRMRGAKASYARPSQSHVTLKFLGDVDDDKRALLVAACEPARRALRPFTLTLAGVGAFPDARRPKVLWAGVALGTPELRALAHGIDDGTEPLGFAREKRAFTPHLTLARIKAGGAEKAAAAALEGLAVGEVATWRVTSFELMQSVQRPDGVSYVRVHSLNLEE
jgi:RNA 2',3'-cyclic 3'-phosphodiesterase